MGIQESMKEFITNLAKELVDKKDEVNVDVSVSTKSILVQIKTAKQDTGKIIGKKGRTIEAIKVIALAAKNTKFSGDSKGISIEILENENFTKQLKNKIS